jgi:hypothetical protein
MPADRDFYVEKANYCTLMSQRSLDSQMRDNWLRLATQWLSFASTGSLLAIGYPDSLADNESQAELRPAAR